MAAGAPREASGTTVSLPQQPRPFQRPRPQPCRPPRQHQTPATPQNGGGDPESEGQGGARGQDDEDPGGSPACPTPTPTALPTATPTPADDCPPQNGGGDPESEGQGGATGQEEDDGGGSPCSTPAPIPTPTPTPAPVSNPEPTEEGTDPEPEPTDEGTDPEPEPTEEGTDPEPEATEESTDIEATATPVPATVPASMAAPSLTVHDKSLMISWNAPADGGSPITKYNVEYKSSVLSTWSDAGSVSAVTKLPLRNLLNDQSYDVQVQACNTQGCGGWSTPASATPSAASVTISSDKSSLTAGSSVTLTASTARAPLGHSPSYQWQIRFTGGEWSNVGTSRNTLAYYTDKAETIAFRVIVTYNSESFTSNSLSVTWSPAGQPNPTATPVASFAAPINKAAPGGTLLLSLQCSPIVAREGRSPVARKDDDRRLGP